MNLLDHLPEVAGALAAVSTAWTLYVRTKKALRRAIIEAVDERFASKHDIQRLEAKLDDMYRVVIRASHTTKTQK